MLTAATLAFEHDDEEAHQQARRTWKEIAWSFWERTAEEDRQQKLKTPKLYRTEPDQRLISILRDFPLTVFSLFAVAV